jgi:hypothetical protein
LTRCARNDENRVFEIFCGFIKIDYREILFPTARMASHHHPAGIPIFPVLFGKDGFP